MASNFIRAPRQWALPDDDTMNITKFENWKSNLLYGFSLNPSFAPFLVNGMAWCRKSNNIPNRGLISDNETVPENKRQTAAQKAAALELMLGQIANYCTVISRQTIINNSTSLSYIWQAIRTHFGFQSTGGHFLDFSEIKLLPDERPETLYQRILAFVSDNLLTVEGGISHHGELIDQDEELSPTIENLITITWLRLLHPSLPCLVKQRYGTELRSQTLASLKPEISQALSTLLDELRTNEDIRVMRSAGNLGHSKPRPSFNQRFNSKPHSNSSQKYKGQVKFKVCPYCQQAGRPDNHFLSQCHYLPDSDRRQFKSSNRAVAVEETEFDDSFDESDLEYAETPLDQVTTISRRVANTTISSMENHATARRVDVESSPYFFAHYNQHPLRLTIDNGAETNMIKESFALSINAPISKAYQSASQLDGKSPLTVKGETHITIERNGLTFDLHALVIKDMDVDILAGVPFQKLNDVYARPSKDIVIFTDGSTYKYNPSKSS